MERLGHVAADECKTNGGLRHDAAADRVLARHAEHDAPGDDHYEARAS
jgi:hypothetical protein